MCRLFADVLFSFSICVQGSASTLLDGPYYIKYCNIELGIGGKSLRLTARHCQLSQYAGGKTKWVSERSREQCTPMH
jgi:hypothetical protein